MQTFLPYPDFFRSATCLDYRRLGKQRVECLQLLNSSLKLLHGESVKGWANHPARLMWSNHLYQLAAYSKVVCSAWTNLGYKDTCLLKITELVDQHAEYFPYCEPPPWIGNPSFHASHQSNLIRKGREKLDKTGDSSLLDHYQSLWPNVPDNLPYIWPV